jgi:hypothetical protein
VLFLAGGRASFKRDPLSIGALVMSFCPKFPIRATDNQYHMQAVRHMYVLAVEWRSLVTIDVDSRASVSVDIKLRINSTKGVVREEVLKTPCLLPELSTISEIQIISKEYCSYVHVMRPAHLVSKIVAVSNRCHPSVLSMLYVKRRSLAKSVLAISGKHLSVFDYVCFLCMSANPYLRELFETSAAATYLGGRSHTFHFKTLQDTHDKNMRNPCGESFRTAVQSYILDDRLPLDPASRETLSVFLLTYGMPPRQKFTLTPALAAYVFSSSISSHEIGIRLVLCTAL